MILQQWSGIVALIDPPLSDSAKMIAEIKELGVKVKMLTGDALADCQGDSLHR